MKQALSTLKRGAGEMEAKEELEQMMTSFLNKANEEEIALLKTVFKGIEEKRSGKYVSYVAAFTQMEAKFLPNGDYEITIPIQPLIYNHLKMVHGGITATLADTAMGTMISEKLPPDLSVVTAEIKMNYIKPGLGKYLRCVATLLNQGKHLCVTEAKIYSDKNELVASALGTFFIIKKQQKDSTK